MNDIGRALDDVSASSAGGAPFLTSAAAPLLLHARRITARPGVTA